MPSLLFVTVPHRPSPQQRGQGSVPRLRAGRSRSCRKPAGPSRSPIPSGRPSWRPPTSSTPTRSSCRVTRGFRAPGTPRRCCPACRSARCTPSACSRATTRSARWPRTWACCGASASCPPLAGPGSARIEHGIGRAVPAFLGRGGVDPVDQRVAREFLADRGAQRAGADPVNHQQRARARRRPRRRPPRARARTPPRRAGRGHRPARARPRPAAGAPRPAAGPRPRRRARRRPGGPAGTRSRARSPWTSATSPSMASDDAAEAHRRIPHRVPDRRRLRRGDRRIAQGRPGSPLGVGGGRQEAVAGPHVLARRPRPPPRPACASRAVPHGSARAARQVPHCAASRSARACARTSSRSACSRSRCRAMRCSRSVAQAFGLAPRPRRGQHVPRARAQAQPQLEPEPGTPPGSAHPSAGVPVTSPPGPRPMTASGSPSDSAMSSAWDAP